MVVTFTSVRYRAYTPARVQIRATVRTRRGGLMSVEKPTWPEIIKLLEQLYPNTEFPIPDEFAVIEYDSKFIPIP